MSDLDLQDSRYYLIDTNLIIDISGANHVTWVEKMIPKGSVFLVLDSVSTESSKTLETIREIFVPFAIDVKFVSFDDPAILRQYELIQNNFSYSLLDKKLSEQDMQILAVSMIHHNLKVITNDGQLQYAIMDIRTRDMNGDVVPERRYVEGHILDQRKFGFSKGDIYNKYSRLLFKAGHYSEVIRACSAGIRYLEELHPKDAESDPLIPYDSEVTRETRELLLNQLGWTYVRVGTAEQLLNVAEKILEINPESRYAVAFIEISKSKRNNLA